MDRKLFLHETALKNLWILLSNQDVMARQATQTECRLILLYEKDGNVYTWQHTPTNYKYSNR